MIGTEIYASKIGQTKFFYHNDHLGGVNIITDSFGNIGQRTEYSIWGGVSYSSGAIDTTHRFTGQEFDAETGLYYYGGRYYDAETGRFISPDPFIQEPYNPQNLNRYTYVLNNPQNLIDPTGFNHETKSPRITGLRFFLTSMFSAWGGAVVGARVGTWAGTAASAGGGGFSPTAAAAIGGAAGGFTGGFINAAGYGRNPLLGGLTGGAIGATLGFLIGAAIEYGTRYSSV